MPAFPDIAPRPAPFLTADVNVIGLRVVQFPDKSVPQRRLSRFRT
jgi:hypothetical protein